MRALQVYFYPKFKEPIAALNRFLGNYYGNSRDVNFQILSATFNQKYLSESSASHLTVCSRKVLFTVQSPRTSIEDANTISGL